jgi:hypothetical protein
LASTLNKQLFIDIVYLVLLVSLWVELGVAIVAYVKLRSIIVTFVLLAEQHLQAQLMSLSAAAGAAASPGPGAGAVSSSASSAAAMILGAGANPGTGASGAGVRTTAIGVAAVPVGVSVPLFAGVTNTNGGAASSGAGVNSNGTIGSYAPPVAVYPTLQPSRYVAHYGHQVDTVVIQRGMRVLGVFLAVAALLILFVCVISRYVHLLCSCIPRFDAI